MTYKKVSSEFDFDLPEVKDAPKAKVRVHNAGDSTCISCEG